MDTIEKLYRINAGLDRRFPDGGDPFMIVSRLAEECGELAGEVNHFENRGVKVLKHGPPNPQRLAKEVQDVLRAALQIAAHYGIQDALAVSIDTAYQNMQQEGLVD
jgi:NTP pyrophosphatase (non-canonical NTP hydrolase)